MSRVEEIRRWPLQGMQHLLAPATAGLPHEIYRANSVSFDGTNDYLTRGADLTGNADGKTGLLSFWLNFQGGDTLTQRVIEGPTAYFRASRVGASSGLIQILGFNSAAASILKIESTSATLLSGTGWHHILASWDLAATTGTVYIDDVADLNAGTALFTNDTIDYVRASPNWSIGAQITGANPLFAYLGEFYFGKPYLDITVEANRRLFIDSNHKPVYLGADGSVPTGAIPIIFCSGATSTWHTNDGSGGGFTENGALTDGSSPSA